MALPESNEVKLRIRSLPRCESLDSPDFVSGYDDGLTFLPRLVFDEVI